MKILVLEDNERLCSLIKTALSHEGYIVDTINDGEKALEKINNGYSCFILDINVPSLDGISVLKHIKIHHKQTPSIIISSNHDLQKIKQSYEIGCDDYLKKPFFIYELVQKVKKMCEPKLTLLNLGDGIVFDIEKRCLFQNAILIKLARKELLLLELLSKNTDQIFSFYEIEEYVWEGEESSLMNIRALVRRIRKKLPKDCIKIVKGIGYSLNIKK